MNFQKIERLKSNLHLLDVDSKPQKHLVFVDSDKEGKCLKHVSDNKILFVPGDSCNNYCSLYVPITELIICSSREIVDSENGFIVDYCKTNCTLKFPATGFGIKAVFMDSC